MKKYLLPLLLACAAVPFVSQAQAQGKRAMCMQRCTETTLYPERQQAHEAKLKAIQDKKAAETDPQARAQLAQQEEDEQEKYLAATEKVCKRICGNFAE